MATQGQEETVRRAALVIRRRQQQLVLAGLATIAFLSIAAAVQRSAVVPWELPAALVGIAAACMLVLGARLAWSRCPNCGHVLADEGDRKGVRLNVRRDWQCWSCGKRLDQMIDGS